MMQRRWQVTGTERPHGQVGSPACAGNNLGQATAGDPPLKELASPGGTSAVPVSPKNCLGCPSLRTRRRCLRFMSTFSTENPSRWRHSCRAPAFPAGGLVTGGALTVIVTS